MVDKRNPSLRGEVLGADTTGTAVMSRCNSNKYSQKIIQQEEEYDRRAMARFILNAEVTTEVEAKPGAG